MESDYSEIPEILKIPPKTSRSIDAICDTFNYYQENKRMSSYGVKAISMASEVLSDIEPNSLKVILKEFPILLENMRAEEWTFPHNQSDTISGKVGSRNAHYELCFSDEAAKAYKEELKRRIGIISPHIGTAFNTDEIDEEFSELATQVFNRKEALIKQIKPLNEHLFDIYQKVAITYVLVEDFEEKGVLDLHELSSKRDIVKRLKKAGFEVMNPLLESVLSSDFGYKAASILPYAISAEAVAVGVVNQNDLLRNVGFLIGGIGYFGFNHLRENYKIIEKDRVLMLPAIEEAINSPE